MEADTPFSMGPARELWKLMLGPAFSMGPARELWKLTLPLAWGLRGSYGS